MGDLPGRGGRLIEAALAALLGAAIWWDAAGYPPALSEEAPGPGFFPRLVAAALIGCAGWLAFRAVRQRLAPGAGPDPATRGGSHEWRAWAAVLAIALFLLLQPILGALVSLPLLAAGLMWLAGERALRVLVGVPLVFGASGWLLFAGLLGVPLP